MTAETTRRTPRRRKGRIAFAAWAAAGIGLLAAGIAVLAASGIGLAAAALLFAGSAALLGMTERAQPGAADTPPPPGGGAGMPRLSGPGPG